MSTTETCANATFALTGKDQIVSQLVEYIKTHRGSEAVPTDLEDILQFGEEDGPEDVACEIALYIVEDGPGSITVSLDPSESNGSPEIFDFIVRRLAVMQGARYLTPVHWSTIDTRHGITGNTSYLNDQGEDTELDEESDTVVRIVELLKTASPFAESNDPDEMRRLLSGVVGILRDTGRHIPKGGWEG